MGNHSLFLQLSLPDVFRIYVHQNGHVGSPVRSKLWCILCLFLPIPKKTKGVVQPTAVAGCPKEPTWHVSLLAKGTGHLLNARWTEPKAFLPFSYLICRQESWETSFGGCGENQNLVVMEGPFLAVVGIHRLAYPEVPSTAASHSIMVRDVWRWWKNSGYWQPSGGEPAKQAAAKIGELVGRWHS